MCCNFYLTFVAHLTSRDLDSSEGCILTFKYSSGPYFGTIQLDVMTADSKWKEGIISYSFSFYIHLQNSYQFLS